MKKLFMIVLSLLTFLLPVASTGCFQPTEDSESPSSIESSEVESGEDSSSNVEEGEEAPFTVALQTMDGSSVEDLETQSISAIWTSVDGASVFQAPFNGAGEASSVEPDGEYQVTLSKIPSGYTYNPNIYEANNKNKKVVIELYPLREFTGSYGTDPYNPLKAETIGAYRFTFNDPSDEFYFQFAATYAGKISFESLLDVTANEILPYFAKGANAMYFGNPQKITGGGAENTYTKNFYWEHNLTDSQDLIFVMGVEAREDATFPVIVDLLIDKSEYEGEGFGYEVVKAPVDLAKAEEPKKKTSFVLLADSAGQWNGGMAFKEELVAFDEETGYYYRNKNYGKRDSNDNALAPAPDLNKKIYAVLTRDIPDYYVYTDPGGNVPNMGLSYRKEHLCSNSKKDYSEFINAYFEKVNSDGTYPVDAALKEYLYDYSVSRNLFHDMSGLGGFPEEHRYQSTGGARWMFVCGFYEYDIIIGG